MNRARGYKLIDTCAISRMGDRRRHGLYTRIERYDPGEYVLRCRRPIGAIYFEAHQPSRIFTVSGQETTRYIHSFNADNAGWPGADLRVWIFGTEAGDDVTVLDSPERFTTAGPFQVQPHCGHHRFAEVVRNGDEYTVTTLLTRSPRTPLTTPFSVVLPRNIPLVLPALTWSE